MTGRILPNQHGCNVRMQASRGRAGVPRTEADAERLAVALFRGALRALPASAGAWFGALSDRGLAARVEVRRQQASCSMAGVRSNVRAWVQAEVWPLIDCIALISPAGDVTM